MASPVTWIAGPVQYWEGNYVAFDLAWEFVGGNAAGEIRRWRLRYKAETRSFSVAALMADRGDQSHASQIAGLYRHVAIRRADLPKGAILVALKAMLPEREVAAAVREALKGGRKRRA